MWKGELCIGASPAWWHIRPNSKQRSRCSRYTSSHPVCVLRRVTIQPHPPESFESGMDSAHFPLSENHEPTRQIYHFFIPSIKDVDKIQREGWSATPPPPSPWPWPWATFPPAPSLPSPLMAHRTGLFTPVRCRIPISLAWNHAFPSFLVDSFAMLRFVND